MCNVPEDFVRPVSGNSSGHGARPVRAAAPAVLTLDLGEGSRKGTRVYHTLEYRVTGVVPWGRIRTVRG